MKAGFWENAAEVRLTLVLRVSLLLLIGCITLLSLVPPVSRDALVHHLNIPKLYLHYGKNGRVPLDVVFLFSHESRPSIHDTALVRE